MRMKLCTFVSIFDAATLILQVKYGSIVACKKRCLVYCSFVYETQLAVLQMLNE